jgi:uncharacterized protein (DUF433 family)
VYEAQVASGLAGDFCLVSVANDQLLLTTTSQEFVERVRWSDDIAVSWRSHDDPRSPVTMSPDVRFGRPSIKGISTDVIWEHEYAGEDLGEIAMAFDLDLDDVRWALSYEYSAHAKAGDRRRRTSRRQTSPSRQGSVLLRRRRPRTRQVARTSAQRRYVPR